MGSEADPKALFYQAQKLRVRAMRLIEAVERLIGARPGQKLEVNFRAATLETTIRRAGRRLALPSPRAPRSSAGAHRDHERVAGWLPVTSRRAPGVALTLASDRGSDPQARLTHLVGTDSSEAVSRPAEAPRSRPGAFGSTAHPKRPCSDSSSASITSTPAERN